MPFAFGRDEVTSLAQPGVLLGIDYLRRMLGRVGKSRRRREDPTTRVSRSAAERARQLRPRLPAPSLRAGPAAVSARACSSSLRARADRHRRSRAIVAVSQRLALIGECFAHRPPAPARRPAAPARPRWPPTDEPGRRGHGRLPLPGRTHRYWSPSRPPAPSPGRIANICCNPQRVNKVSATP